MFPDEVMRAQLYEKLEREKSPSQTTSRNDSRPETPDSGFDTQKSSAYDNKGLDITDCEASTNVEDNNIPGVGFKNGRLRHRQMSNQSISGVAETTTWQWTSTQD